MKNTRIEWPLIDRRVWRRSLRKLHPLYRGKVKRIYPGTPDYDLILLLRYEALVEGGIIDPGTIFIESMAAKEDVDDIILAFFVSGKAEATLTLRKCEGPASGYLLVILGGCSSTPKGRRGISLLTDTAGIICAGLKRKGLISLIPEEAAPEYSYENWEGCTDEGILGYEGLYSHLRKIGIEKTPTVLILDISRYMPEGWA